MGWWPQQWWVATLVVLWAMTNPAASDPQINLLNQGCSQYNSTNLSDFFRNLNATFADLRSHISVENKKFATAQQARTSNPVYAMAQCRNYLTTADCVACFDAAVAQIRSCSGANGARIIYDGCFLRYESNVFFEQTTVAGDVGICRNRTVAQATAFDTAVQGLLTDLETATPRINGFYVAATRAVTGGGTVYAVAQCAQTVSESGCRTCLQVAYNNIQGCPPGADARAVDAGCFLRYSDTAFFADNQTTNISHFLGGSSKKKTIIEAVGGGGGGLLLLAVLATLWYRRSRKVKAVERANLLGSTELQGPVAFSYRVLKSVTNNFSDKNKLGEGGFGDVYKGILKNGKAVAVKRLALVSGQAKSDFESEVRLISNVCHRNVIRLLGCCSTGPQLLLVYDYMANGSLDKFLYGESRGTLNWKQRFDIIFSTARGLAYLHDQFHVRIIHRDIKSSNILLDDEFQPKIADFGLARLLPEDRSHLSTKFAGTLGYIAPEYAIHGQLSEKADTYSFGIVVLEIVSGRRCNEIRVDPVTECLLKEAWRLYEDDQHMQLVDETLDPNEHRAEDLKKVIEIALMCTQSPASARPTMSEVVLLLSAPAADPRRLRRPTFIDNETRVCNDTSTSITSSTSNATVSFTEFTGR
ncbi:Non-specific serine/threonine protein kinase [Bertholletia excelsa]